VNIAEGVFFIVIVIALWLLPACWVGRVARRKGRRFWRWFVGALVFWLVAAIAVVLADDLRHRAARPARQSSLPPPPPPPPAPLPLEQQTASLPDSTDRRVDRRVEDLERLHRLHREGALTAEEFNAQKRRILDA
jgi:hypothetical protein